MDRLKEIKDKYEMNGVESLTADEAEFVLDVYKKSLNNIEQFIRVGHIVSEYYTQKDDLAKIVEICNCEFMAGEEILSLYTFRDYMKGKSIEKIEGLDYLCVHRYLGDYYDSHHYIDDSYEEKAKEHWEKGAEQGSFFCAQHLYDYYLKDRNGKKPTKDDFEKAIHFAKQCLNSKQILFGSFSAEDLFVKIEESDNLTKEERERLNNIILESKELIYNKAECYWQLFRYFDKKDDFDLCVYWCELSASKGYDKAYELLGDIYSGYWYEHEFLDYKKALYYYEKGKKYYMVARIIERLIESGKNDELEKCSVVHLLIATKYFENNFTPKEFDRMVPTLIKINKFGFRFNGKQDFKRKLDYCKKVYERTKDPYYSEIKSLIDNEGNVVYIENISDLGISKISDENETLDKNEMFSNKIKSIISNLDNQNKNVVIEIERNTRDMFAEYYKLSDMKKIIRAIDKLVNSIDLNQNQEDVFMQIYIKLGLMISYDYDALKKMAKEKKSISRNLMVILNKKGVCKGYAILLNDILNIIGIKSNVLYSSKHAYNQVKINGKWYFCDLTWDSSRIKSLKLLGNCLKSKEKFTTFISHQSLDTDKEHEANEDYPNVQHLFIKNRFKLFKKKLNTPLEQLIEPAGIKEDGGRSI